MDMSLIQELTPKKEMLQHTIDLVSICIFKELTCLNFDKRVDLSFFLNFFQCKTIKVNYENVKCIFFVPHVDKINYHLIVIF